MSRLKIPMLALGLSAIPLLAGFAKSPNLRIKTGLWESTVVARINGQLPIPDDVLARMTPEQRKNLEATMEATNVRNAKPRTAKICITQEKLDRGFELDDSNRPNCKRTILANTADAMEVQEECTDNTGTTKVDIHYRAIDPETIQGATHAEMTRQGKKLVSDGSIQGKWIGADCGNIK